MVTADAPPAQLDGGREQSPEAWAEEVDARVAAERARMRRRPGLWAVLIVAYLSTGFITLSWVAIPLQLLFIALMLRLYFAPRKDRGRLSFLRQLSLGLSGALSPGTGLRWARFSDTAAKRGAEPWLEGGFVLKDELRVTLAVRLRQGEAVRGFVDEQLSVRLQMDEPLPQLGLEAREDALRLAFVNAKEALRARAPLAPLELEFELDLPRRLEIYACFQTERGDPGKKPSFEVETRGEGLLRAEVAVECLKRLFELSRELISNAEEIAAAAKSELSSESSIAGISVEDALPTLSFAMATPRSLAAWRAETQRSIRAQGRWKPRRALARFIMVILTSIESEDGDEWGTGELEFPTGPYILLLMLLFPVVAFGLLFALVVHPWLTLLTSLLLAAGLVYVMLRWGRRLQLDRWAYDPDPRRDFLVDALLSELAERLPPEAEVWLERDPALIGRWLKLSFMLGAAPMSWQMELELVRGQLREHIRVWRALPKSMEALSSIEEGFREGEPSLRGLHIEGPQLSVHLATDPQACAATGLRDTLAWRPLSKRARRRCLEDEGCAEGVIHPKAAARGMRALLQLG